VDRASSAVAGPQRDLQNRQNDLSRMQRELSQMCTQTMALQVSEGERIRVKNKLDSIQRILDLSKNLEPHVRVGMIFDFLDKGDPYCSKFEAPHYQAGQSFHGQPGAAQFGTLKAQASRIQPGRRRLLSRAEEAKQFSSELDELDKHDAVNAVSHSTTDNRLSKELAAVSNENKKLVDLEGAKAKDKTDLDAAVSKESNEILDLEGAKAKDTKELNVPNDSKMEDFKEVVAPKQVGDGASELKDPNEIAVEVGELDDTASKWGGSRRRRWHFHHSHRPHLHIPHIHHRHHNHHWHHRHHSHHWHHRHHRWHVHHRHHRHHLHIFCHVQRLAMQAAVGVAQLAVGVAQLALVGVQGVLTAARAVLQGVLVAHTAAYALMQGMASTVLAIQNVSISATLRPNLLDSCLAASVTTNLGGTQQTWNWSLCLRDLTSVITNLYNAAIDMFRRLFPLPSEEEMMEESFMLQLRQKMSSRSLM